jgi:uncharacterized protein YdaU (DUF1376 family)
MAKSKSPAFQFYPKDWLSDLNVMTMTPAQRGGYIQLLCVMWLEDDCSLPNNPQALCILSGLSEEEIGKVMECFVPHGDRLTQKRLQAEKKKQKEYSRKMSRAGKKGNAIKYGSKDTEGRLGDKEAVASARSSSSTSSSNKEKTNTKRISQKEKDEMDKHPMRAWMKDNTPTVRRMKIQPTPDQCDNLVQEYGKDIVKEVLLSMENHAPLLKKYKDVYFTANNWCKKRIIDNRGIGSTPTKASGNLLD